MIHKITIQHRIILFLFHAESLSNGLGITRAQLAAPWVCGACFRLCFWGIFSLRACLHTEVRTRSKTHTRTRTRTSSKTKTRSRSKNARAHTLKSVHTYMLENAHTHTLGNAQTHENTQALSYVPVNVCVCSLCVFLLRLVPHAIRPLFPSVALEPWIIVFFSFFFIKLVVFLLCLPYVLSVYPASTLLIEI